MSLSAFTQASTRTVARHEPVFRAARRLEPDLAAWETASSLLDAFALPGALSITRRQAVVRALLRRHRLAPHALWSAMLTILFEPLLRGLRRRHRGSPDDRDTRVGAALFEAFGRVPLGAPALFLAIQSAASRALFASVRRDARRPDETTLDEGLALGRAPHEDAGPFVACLAREVLQRAASRGAPDVALVLAGAETTGEQAARKGESVAACKKRRQRTLTALRRELGS